jgi:hypothetical protein
MANPKKGNTNVILWVALGCGGLLFLVTITCVAAPFVIAHFAKNKIAEEVAKKNPALATAIRNGGIQGGVQAGAGQMVAAGASVYGIMVLVTTLPKDEQKENLAVLERLVKVGPQLTTDDIDAITKLLDKVQKPHEADKSLPTADEARALMAEIKPIAEKYEPK